MNFIVASLVFAPIRRARSPVCRSRAGDFDIAAAGTPGSVFIFFSNNLGCLGSLIVSAVVTLILLLLLGVIELH